jgi:hypothetical protein
MRLSENHKKYPMARPNGKDVEKVITAMIGREDEPTNENYPLLCLIGDNKKELFSMYLNGNDDDLYSLVHDAIQKLDEEANPAFETILSAISDYLDEKKQEKIRLN